MASVKVRSQTQMMYAVSAHYYGRKRDGPCAGLLNYPEHKWVIITPRLIGRTRAVALADAQPHHALVWAWMTGLTIYDNRRAPGVPDGWVPVDEDDNG